MNFTFHILGVPHTVTNQEDTSCAYTQNLIKFGKMMTNHGHTVIHYGHEDSKLLCTEHVTVTTNNDFRKAYGDQHWSKNVFKHSLKDSVYQTFYRNAIREIQKRKNARDFILPFWGFGVQPVCEAHKDLICVEPGIGYSSGTFADWRVFVSYALMHAYVGLNGCQRMPSWYDTVIPNYFDINDFEYSEKKDNFFLYMGRVYENKGIYLAEQIANQLGKKLVIAGPICGDVSISPHVEYVGVANTKLRKELLAKAEATLVPSLYLEPFGNVQMESLFSGTPAITTDWGGFTENNIHGVTGYRCRTFGQFVQAAANIGNIDPKNCRSFAENNYTLEKIYPMFEEYFHMVIDVYTSNGWYSDRNGNLNWLKKEYK